MSATSKKKWRIGVLVSGGGTNLQALIDAIQAKEIHAEIPIVISNKRHAYAISRAKAAGIEGKVFDKDKFPSRTEMGSKITEALLNQKVDLVCLAGYLLKIEPSMIRAFPNRILNIHPALLPKYGGKGMFGQHVHEAVLAANEKVSGCTVHLVDEHFDHGPILGQETVPVKPGDTPATLAERLLPKEHALYLSVVKKICDGKIDLDKIKNCEPDKR